MNTITIKEILSSQPDQYTAFIENAIAEDGGNLLITQHDLAAEGFPTKDTADSFTLGAWAGDELAGIASFIRDGENREKLRHKGLISTMYVAKACRGMGIAKQLLTTIIQRVKTNPDIEQINLIVLNSNTKAKRLYESFGFHTYGTETNSIKWNGAYFAEDLMVLHLTTQKL